MNINFLKNIWVIVIFLFLFACKTSEPVQTNKIDNRTRDELLQSKIDTTTSAFPTPIKIGEPILLANQMALIYCDMKQYEDKDMSDKDVLNAFENLDNKYQVLQERVHKLTSQEKQEYQQQFEEKIKKCK